MEKTKFQENYQKLLILVLILLPCFFFLYLVRGILFPFFMAGVIAYLVNPLIEKLLGRGFNRLGALILLFSMLVTISLIFGIFGLPLIVDDLNSLAQTLPTYVTNLQNRLDQVYSDFKRIKLPAIVKQVADQTLLKVEQFGLDFVNRLTDLTLNIFSHLMNLIMAPIIAFYILKDLEELNKSAQLWIPKQYRKEVIQLMSEINGVLNGFMRGQFLVAILIAAFTTVGLVILKVKFAIVLGIFAGAFNIIPYLGPILGAIPAVAIVLIKSPIQAVGVIILFVVIQQIESGFISPRIMADKVGLHPVTVIFAVLAGGQIGGIIGMILAVPIAGIVKVILKFIREKLGYFS
ncbi:MAG: AI-2E family transporter [Halanaerobiales bacterium]|nr:AI-2E family transporter [Halanaerobiales bacterium]